ncbi:glcNAc-PI de-N-acetylase domain-containing protein [Hirsutella rhossiliensis]|uniref:N-acetylglucosaminylphosphatidylinositol deacetylase n=1 Tax=Hirsutella rhossiliensis TaxID=111463 RepID=A0A9P8N0B2_9HYPO|nr:glcNAc-PI de-N-acetylase domain-containing protein [Hirsutella rhossiliensis]KAH0964267.1 glcNAc-PI de-N-acetylase domain-containing protein [Hirsutella rhossiliensis]
MPRKTGDQAAFEFCSWLLAKRIRRRTLVRIALVVLPIPIVLQWTLAYLVGSDARLLPLELQHAKSLLIMTAHPDDECLFFAPSILSVLDGSPNTKGGLLVMSTGDHYGIGAKRRQELKGSCVALGIDLSRCEALDHPDLQDSPSVWWDTAKIQSIIKDYVRKWDVDAVNLILELGGISGHVNHRAVSAAVREYVMNDGKAPAAYMLVTTSLIRKFTALFDLPLTVLPFTWRIFAAIFSLSTTEGPRYSKKALVASTWHRREVIPV